MTVSFIVAVYHSPAAESEHLQWTRASLWFSSPFSVVLLGVFEGQKHPDWLGGRAFQEASPGAVSVVDLLMFCLFNTPFCSFGVEVDAILPARSIPWCLYDAAVE